jgi:hypothetical protein
LAAAQPEPVAKEVAEADVAEALQNSPVMFIEKVGQFSNDARFHVRGGKLDLWLADDALWITLLEAAPQSPRRGVKARAALRLCTAWRYKCSL